MRDGDDEAFAPLNDTPGKKNKGPNHVPILPVPSDAPAATFRHREYGEPVATWPYLNEKGELLGYVARFETRKGKQIIPRTYCADENGRQAWRWKSFPVPRPLYRLDQLAARSDEPVLVVEGEKTADYAQAMFRDHVVITWPGGGKAASRADWSPLKDRQVTLWPDADPEGRSAMAEIARLLQEQVASSVRVVSLPSGLREGWDLADDIPVGFEPRLLLENAQQMPPAPLLPVGYRFNANGLVWREDEDDSADLLLAGHFDVLAETRDVDGSAWGVLLGWKDNDGRPHQHALPRSILAGDGTDARRILLEGGLHVAPGRKAREKLNNFLVSVRSQGRARATARVGWHDGVFVLPDGSIGTTPGGELLLLQQSGTVKHSFRQRGTLTEWQEKVARLAVGNSRLMLAVSAAFAAVLLEPCKAESGGIHFRGQSSTGKSTALVMASSAWGGGEPGSYVRSWRATANGLEGVALAHCDTLLCLDELSQASAREAGEVTYMLGNGSGKSRSTREGLARQPSQWRVLFLSSGEVSLTDKIAEDGRGRKVAAGQSVRLIDLPADAGSGLGLFENLHGYESADAFARHIKTVSAANYGLAARAFLTHVVADRNKAIDTALDYTKKFAAQHVAASVDGQVSRAAQRFGLIAAAGEIAIQAGILPWQPGSASGAAARCLQDWIASRGGTEAAEVRDGVAQVQSFIAAHGMARFVAFWEDGHADLTVRDIAGYRKRSGEGWDYFVTPSAWTGEVCRGFHAPTIAAVLADRGLLIRPETGRHLTCQIRIPLQGRLRLYHLSSKLLEASND